MKEKCLVAIIAVAYAMLPDDKRKSISTALKCVANAKDTVRIIECCINKPANAKNTVKLVESSVNKLSRPMAA